MKTYKNMMLLFGWFFSYLRVIIFDTKHIYIYMGNTPCRTPFYACKTCKKTLHLEDGHEINELHISDSHGCQTH